MRKRNIALILAASMMATFAFGGTTAFAAEEGVLYQNNCQ